MKLIQIQAEQFFDLLKMRDTSMWEIFSQMIEDEPKLISFLDEDGAELFQYQLPTTVEQLETDRKLFSEEFSRKLNEVN